MEEGNYNIELKNLIVQNPELLAEYAAKSSNISDFCKELYEYLSEEEIDMLYDYCIEYTDEFQMRRIYSLIEKTSYDNYEIYPFMKMWYWVEYQRRLKK